MRKQAALILIAMLLSASMYTVYMYAEAAEQNVVMEIEGMSCSL